MKMVNPGKNNSGILASIQVGLPASYPDGPRGKPWRTAFFKQPIQGPVRVQATGLEGDGQADSSVHGGVDKAVLAYSADHYPLWRGELAIDELHHGGFGENLTIRSLCEQTVCLGDIWRAGNVRFQISQPRQPCWKLARRWNIRRLPKLVIESGRSGWYLRVLETGTIDTGEVFSLVDRPHPDWPVARASKILHHRTGTRAELMALMAIRELAAAWKEDLR
jgi:MOSC domain-containing protein YiiM